MSKTTAAESRKFWASLLMLAIVCGLIAYLTFIPVPSDNKEIIVTVLGVLIGGASAAMPNLFGSKDGETEALKTEIHQLREDHMILNTKHDTLRDAYDKIISLLVERHVIQGEGIEA